MSTSRWTARIEAWAGQKSFKRKDAVRPSPPSDDPGNPSIDFRGERPTNAPYASTTDLETRLYKKAKGQEAKLSYLGHVLIENRQGLVVDTHVTQATGTTEQEAALAMAEAISGQQRVTVGADKGYDTHDVIHELRQLQVTPHVAQHIARRSSAIDGRTPRHPGYAASPRKRKCVEEIFRLDENGGATAQGPASRRGTSGMDIHLCSGRVQPGADAHADGSGISLRAPRETSPLLHLAAPT